MRSCKEVTALISESLDRRLPLGQRLAVRLHLMMYRFCSRYRKQLLAVRVAIHRYVEELEPAESVDPFLLSQEARSRISRAMACQTITK